MRDTSGQGREKWRNRYTNERKADRAEERRKLKEGSTWSSRKKARKERGDRDRETATEEGRM